MRRVILKVVVSAIPFLFSCSGGKPVTVNEDGDDVIQTWRMTELRFESSTDYTSGGSDKVMMDVTFTHVQSGETHVRPAFWDGSKVFLVRFAPTKDGQWTWKSACPEDKSLDGEKGKFSCERYSGDLPVYQHGFVKAVDGKKYMTFADGTPFFYLGDTHWGMYREEIDAPGPNAGNTGADSHFKYIVNRRVEQGFTVYQSEPIDAAFHVQDGRVDAEDIFGFRRADQYYKHIADRGLVHANAEFFFAGELSAELAKNDKALENLSRYWVARFGAFPVIWTLAQEIDNDFYNERGDQRIYTFADNPWVKVAEYIHKYDNYGHPLSGHQENTWYTTVTGRGTTAGGRDGDGASVFASEETARRTGHNWWAVQWSPSLTEPVNPDLVRDYWQSSRMAVNYEGRYCGLWTKDFGARVQGWVSFLSGFFGYGYGAIDMWLYKSTYNIDVASDDGIERISIADKAKPWSEAIEFPSANQMTFLRKYFEKFDWWNLVPVLPGDKGFEPKAKAYAYAKTSDTHVLYFFSKDKETGKVVDLQPGKSFKLTWFNPRSGEMADSLTMAAGPDGKLSLPEKPDKEDWVLMIQ